MQSESQHAGIIEGSLSGAMHSLGLLERERVSGLDDAYCCKVLVSEAWCRWQKHPGSGTKKAKHYLGKQLYIYVEIYRSYEVMLAVMSMNVSSRVLSAIYPH